jgi:hypothetical protein
MNAQKLVLLCKTTLFENTDIKLCIFPTRQKSLKKPSKIGYSSYNYFQ